MKSALEAKVRNLEREVEDLDGLLSLKVRNVSFKSLLFKFRPRSL